MEREEDKRGAIMIGNNNTYNPGQGLLPGAHSYSYSYAPPPQPYYSPYQYQSAPYYPPQQSHGYSQPSMGGYSSSYGAQSYASVYPPPYQSYGGYPQPGPGGVPHQSHGYYHQQHGPPQHGEGDPYHGGYPPTQGCPNLPPPSQHGGSGSSYNHGGATNVGMGLLGAATGAAAYGAQKLFQGQHGHGGGHYGGSGHGPGHFGGCRHGHGHYGMFNHSHDYHCKHSHSHGDHKHDGPGELSAQSSVTMKS